MTTALPYRMYLLAYDSAVHGPFNRSRVGCLVRAAAVTELALRGRIVERDGAARVTGSAPTGDPVLDQVLAQTRRPGAGWQHLIRWDRPRTLAAVEDRLASCGLLTVEERRTLVAPSRHVVMSDLAVVRALQEHAAAVLRGSDPTDRVPLDDAALVALAAVGEIGPIASCRDSGHRARVDAIVGRLRELTPGLEQAIRSLRPTMATVRAHS
ncbi:GPP34 family phosphoprotein [Streptomyces sp. NPDC092296]|uniref:GOLPH3/VPS74 family protein n=1 Tax=Streptomyces sp. NPDC092296 TaxID=3366012 RepID=UPI00381283F7